MNMVTKKTTRKVKKVRAGKFNKFTIGEDIRRYMVKEGLICPKCTVIIPEGGYDYVARERSDYGLPEVTWSGNFEVFKNMDDIIGYGGFTALVPYQANSRSNYDLQIRWKKKDYYIWGG